MLVSAFTTAVALRLAVEMLLCAGNVRQRCMPLALAHLAPVSRAGSTPRLLQRLRHSAAGERTSTCSPATVHAQRALRSILAAQPVWRHRHAVTNRRDKARWKVSSSLWGPRSAGVHADDASGVQQSAEAVQTAVDTGKGGIFFGEGGGFQLHHARASSSSRSEPVDRVSNTPAQPEHGAVDTERLAIRRCCWRA